MSNKFDIKNINFNPSSRYGQLTYLLDIEEGNSSVLDYNWQGSDNSDKNFIENSYKIMNEKIEEAISDALVETQIELAEKWETYVALMMTGLVDEPFPFKSWDLEVSSIENGTKDSIHVDVEDVLDGISSGIQAPYPKVNQLARLNLINFLNTSLDKKYLNRRYLTLLSHISFDANSVKNTVPETNKVPLGLINDLIDDETYDHNVIRIIKLASKLVKVKITPKIKFKKLKKEVAAIETVKYEENSLRNDLSDFKNSELWYEIRNDEVFLDKFIENLVAKDKDYSLFYEVDNNMNPASEKSFNINGINVFFDEFVKDDKEFGNKVLSKIDSKLSHNQRQLFEVPKSNAEKIMSYYNLQNKASNLPKPIPPWVKV